MVQFITSNPVTAQINANNDRSAREEEAALRRQEAADLRAQREARDEIGRKFGEMVAQPAQPGAIEQAAPADPYSEKLRAGITMASGMKGGGASAARMAEHLMARERVAADSSRKNRDAQDNKFAEILAKGEFDNAKNYATTIGRNDLVQIFSNPKALAYTSSIAQYAHKSLGLVGNEIGVFQDSAMKALASGMPYGEALSHAASQLKSLPSRAKGRGATGGGGSTSGVGAKFDVDGEGNRVILYRDGTMVYPKDERGNPVKIKAGTNEDQKFVRNMVIAGEKNRFPSSKEDPVARAFDMANKTKVPQSGADVNLPASNNDPLGIR